MDTFLILILVNIAFNCQFSFAQEKKQRSEFEIQYAVIDSLQDISEYDSALSLANLMLDQSRLSSDEELAVLLIKQLSFYSLGYYDSMRIGMAQLEGELEESDSLYSNYLYYRTLLDREDGNYTASISNLMKVVKLFESKKDLISLISAFNSLGANFKTLKEFETAKEYFLNARTLAKQLDRTLSLAMIDNNLGAVFRQLNQLDSALFYYEEARALLSDLDNKFYLAQNLTNLGNIYEQQRDYVKAKSYFEQSLSVSEQAGIGYGVLLSNLNLGNLHRLILDYDQGEIYLKKALAMAEEMGLKSEQGLALERLSWLSRDTRDYKMAYEFGFQAIAIMDSLSSESVKKEAIELRTKYETEKKENEIIRLESESQRFFLILALCLVGILILGLLVLLGRYRQKKMLNEKLLAESERNILSRTLDVKDMELTAQALQIIHIKQLLQMQKEDSTHNGERHPKGRVRTTDFKLGTLESIQVDFENRITSSNEDFFKILLMYYPDLKPVELKLCAFLRLNLSTKEIAEVLNKSIRTIETIRYSLRKKLGLKASDNLISHLIQLEKRKVVAN